MESIIQEIMKSRNGRKLTIDRTNSNRYRLLCTEDDGSKTAYYFAVPIYNAQKRTLLDMSFHNQGKQSCLTGSNARITVAGSIVMENGYGACTIEMSEGYEFRNQRCIAYSGGELYPTTNGVACKISLANHPSPTFRIRTDRPGYCLHYNGKCFALMRDQFEPLITISCIGALNSKGAIIASANIKYEILNATEAELTVESSVSNAKDILLEINMQESKLFQDTTVESKNRDMNNAFGGTAFIGNSPWYGEQWLYSRPDFSKMQDLFEKAIDQTTLYIPMLNQSNTILAAHRLPTRFCSLGSTWGNKKPLGHDKTTSSFIPGYQKIEVTSLMVREKKLLTQSEGWTLKSQRKNRDFCVVSTGDSCFAPQILEVRYN